MCRNVSKKQNYKFLNLRSIFLITNVIELTKWSKVLVFIARVNHYSSVTKAFLLL